jgi:hypothetical protein
LIEKRKLNDNIGISSLVTCFTDNLYSELKAKYSAIDENVVKSKYNVIIRNEEIWKNYENTIISIILYPIIYLNFISNIKIFIL